MGAVALTGIVRQPPFLIGSVTVRSRQVLHTGWFFRDVHTGRLFCLPAHPWDIFYVFTYWTRPMQANKKSTLYLFPSSSCLRWADESVFWIQLYQCHYQCWQMPGFSEFNITSVDKQADFWNSALSSLTDTLIFQIQHCWIFTKSNNPGIRHCWLFAEWRFLRNYIASFLDFIHSMSWIGKSTLQTDNADFLKPSVLCEIHWFSRGQFGSMIEDSNADFLNVPGLPTPAMLFSWNASSCEFS